ncbi:MAG: adenylate/guanylate cyclase domain-containing protein [Alphaproteobacteria bacterium]|nr:MAG: adenylate/guanylate cyclase domain-containing protein [Alphaproteobacteria bacterium]
MTFDETVRMPIWKRELPLAAALFLACAFVGLFNLNAMAEVWIVKGQSLLATLSGAKPEQLLPSFYPLPELALAALAIFAGHFFVRGKPWYAYMVAALTMPFLAIAATYLVWLVSDFVMGAYSSALWTFIVLVGLTVRKVARQLAKALYLRSVLGTSVAPNVIAALSNSDDPKPFSGRSRKLTFLAMEIRGMEDLIDALRDHPDALLDTIKVVTEPMAEEVVASGGTLEALSPTGLRAFWNAPKDLEHHEQIACECAQAMIERMDDINDRIEQSITRVLNDPNPVISQLSIGIGITTGYGVVGNYGSRARPHYSAIGEAADLARVLQSLSETYGPAIIVGERTRNAVQNNFALIEIDRISINDNNPPVVVYALAGNPVRKADPTFQALVDQHRRMFQAYRSQNWQQARIEIEKAKDLGGIHPQLYTLMESRITHLEHQQPASGWDGAFRPLLKGRFSAI